MALAGLILPAIATAAGAIAGYVGSKKSKGSSRSGSSSGKPGKELRFERFDKETQGVIKQALKKGITDLEKQGASAEAVNVLRRFQSKKVLNELQKYAQQVAKQPSALQPLRQLANAKGPDQLAALDKLLSKTPKALKSLEKFANQQAKLPSVTKPLEQVARQQAAAPSLSQPLAQTFQGQQALLAAGQDPLAALRRLQTEGYTPSITDPLLQQTLTALQNAEGSFEKTNQRAIKEFETKTIPSIAERFTAMGGGQRSSAFQ